MSADDQQFLDVLSNIPTHLREYTNGVADFVDHNVDRAAQILREKLSSASWLPEYARPRRPPSAPVAVVSLSRLERAQDWVVRHKILTGVILVICGSAVYKGFRRARSLRKTRRARRAKNGGRSEVVVIAGSPALPLTKSLSLDMERRGFIVFVVCNAAEDEAMVHTLARQDIRPLTIDITNPPSAGQAVERFATFLELPQTPGPRIRPNHVRLRSVVLIPSLQYQTSPIATIPPSSFADLFNTHLLQPILTIQAFLPILGSRICPVGEKWVPPRVMVLTPSIISSINPPFHAPEATVCSALRAFTEVLAAELRPLDIFVTHMQLGTFDFSGFLSAKAGGQSQQGTVTAGNPEDTLVWPEAARHAYGRNFVAQTSSAISGARIRGLNHSSLRHLHNSVFDVIDGSITANTVRVGLGAGLYGMIGRWAPRCLVSWLMGIRKVDELSTWKTSSSDSSSWEGSEDGEASACREFITVPSERNVWNAEAESTRWAASEGTSSQGRTI